MMPWRLLVLWCCATWSWCFAAEVQGVPWLLLRPDDGLRIQFALPGPPEQHAELEPRLIDPDGRDLAIDWQRRPLRRPLAALATLLSGDLTADQWGSGTWRLGLGSERWLDLQLPGRPAVAEDVPLILAGAAGWPTAAALATVEEQAGRQVGLVALLGAGAHQVLGTRDWEHHRLVAQIGASGADDLPLLGQQVAWQRQLSWGAIGLAPALGTEDRRRAESAIGVLAQDFLRWPVLLGDRDWWPLSGGASPSAATHPVQALLEIARRHRLPLAVYPADHRGMVSDVLSVDSAGRIGPMPGGTRLLALSGGAMDLAQLPPTVVQPFSQALCLALIPEGPHLRGLLINPSGLVEVELRWSQWPVPDLPVLHLDRADRLNADLQTWRLRTADDGQEAMPMTLADLARWRVEGAGLRALHAAMERDMTRAVEFADAMRALYPWPPRGLLEPQGWGLGRAEDLLGRGDDRAESLPYDRLVWLPQDEIDVLARSGPHLERALADVLARRGDQRWLARLMAAEPRRSLAWLVRSPELSDELVREQVLRHLHLGAYLEDGGLRELIVRSRDPELLRILARAAEEARDTVVQRHLLHRFRAQAEGTLPLDDDPLLQHRLAVAVFGSPYLSPSLLRPVAVSLQERMDPFARAPLERFLKRFGVESK